MKVNGYVDSELISLVLYKVYHKYHKWYSQMGFVIVFIIWMFVTYVAFSIAAIAAAVLLFASGPVVATQAQAQMMGFGCFGGFHHFGFPFNHFFFHRHFF